MLAENANELGKLLVAQGCAQPSLCLIMHEAPRKGDAHMRVCTVVVVATSLHK